MSFLYSKLKAFFRDADRFSGVNQLFRLQSLPHRPIQQIECCISSHFHESDISQKMDYYLLSLQNQTTLKNLITYLLIFKDLVSIGPEKASLLFLKFKLRFDDSTILRLFYSYLLKVAFNKELFMESVYTYNTRKIVIEMGGKSEAGNYIKEDRNNSSVSLPCLAKAYKTLNLLMEVFGIVDLVMQLEHKETYVRLSMCLISDAVLYFCYIKQTLLEDNPLAHFGDLPMPHTNPQQLLSVIDEFCNATSDFRRILFEYKIQNRYFTLDEQKKLMGIKKALRKQMVSEKTLTALTERDMNVGKGNGGGDFSFGFKTDRCEDHKEKE